MTRESTTLWTFLRRKREPVTEPVPRARPKWPERLRDAGWSDAEIVDFAITYPFGDVPMAFPYHEQGRQALARILGTTSE